jgi:hypothetical protein
MVFSLAGLVTVVSSEENRCGESPLPVKASVIASSLPVPVQHRVYAFLEDLETRGFLVFKANTRPLSRGEIASYLREAIEKHQSQVEEFPFSQREKSEWVRYAEEFYVDKEVIEVRETQLQRFRNSFWKNAPFYSDGLNFYNFRWSRVDAVINPVLYYDIFTDSTGDRLLHRANGLDLKVSFSPSVGFYVDFRDNMESGRGPYNAGERYKLYSDNAGFVNMQGDDYCFYDFTRAVMSIERRNLYLNFGHGDNRWGSGKNIHLLLSANPAPYDYFSGRYKLGNICQFSYLTAALYPYPEVYEDEYLTPEGRERKLVASKYFSGHRLELYPWKGIEIGLNEAVIYGERGLEPAYLIPFNFFHSAQHNLGDRDNILWSVDVEMNLIRGISLYGELLIDDMKTGKLGTDYIGNKFGYIGGAYIASPFRIWNTSFNIEYSRLDPFVYTHFYPINTYKNWNASLGSDLPPNSERWMAKFHWCPLYTLDFELAGIYVRHGANTSTVNAGGNIDTPPDIGQDNASFLGGDIQEDKIIESGIKWEPLENYFIAGTWRAHDFPEGYQNEWRLSIGVSVW